MAVEFDIEPHNRSWRGFCKLMTISVIAIAILLALMAVFLT